MIRLLPSGKVILQLGLLSGVVLGPLIYKFAEKKNKQHQKINDFFHNTRLFVKTDKDIKLVPKLIKHSSYEHGDLFIYSIPNGMAKSQFEAKKEALEHQLKGEIEMWNIDNRLFIKSMTKRLPERVGFCREDIIGMDNAKMGVSIGHSRKGYIINDLSSSGCHMLVAGPTDSGKSVCLRQIILSILLNYNSNYFEMNLIDLKQGLEMRMFEDMPHVTIYESVSETFELLQELNKEINRRGKWLKNANLTSIYDSDEEIPKIITVIDEFAELSNHENIMKQVDRILRLGRASGIHLIISTQRPTVDVISGNMKNNIQARIALNTPSQIDSKTILDEGSAANLPPIKGRAIFKRSSKNIEIQIPFINIKKAEKLLQERLKELGGKKEINNKEEKEFQGMIL